MATFGFDTADHHAGMLLDGVRVRAYARAIARVIKPGDVVADIGAGSGILAVLAARAGAAKVYAVEAGPMAELAEAIVAANGLSDRVEVLRVEARVATFTRPPTVVVTETIGCLAVDEGMFGFIAGLLPRCAASPVIIPQSCEIWLAPLDDLKLGEELERLRAVEGVSLAPLRERICNRIAAAPVHAEDLIGPAAGGGTLVVGRDEAPELVRARLSITRDGTLNAIGGWFSTQLTDEVALCTGPDDPPTSWTNLKCPVDPPLACRAGDVVDVEIEPRLVAHRGFWAWRVALGDQVRSGDAALSAVGGGRDLANQLGLRALVKTSSTLLDAWAVAVGGRNNASVDAMTARVLAGFPDRFSSKADARQAVVALLALSGALL
jgi:hypothetical protein